MPWGLKRFQECGQLHYITFSCYRRMPNLGTPKRRRIVEESLERVRIDYRMLIIAYVIMPEHVHLLVSEPEQGKLATALQSLKQGVARRLALRAKDPFWEPRYYDFNVWSEAKRIDKTR
jgi:putative transposase